MARDRKRAKQRRERAGPRPARPARGAGALSASQPVRADVPGELEHASGEADEFEAAIVRGADGVVAEPDGAADAAEQDAAEDLLQEASGNGEAQAAGARAAARPSGAPVREGNRAIGFVRASWAELQRVQWPDRRGVTQATAVVLGFVAVAGVYLGVADYVAKEIVEYIL